MQCRQSEQVKDSGLSQDVTRFKPRAPEQNKCCMRVMEQDDGYLSSINMLLDTKQRVTGQ